MYNSRGNLQGKGLAIIGDSRIAIGYSESATEIKYSARGWYQWALCRLKHRTPIRYLDGSGGRTLREVLNLIETEILTLDPLPLGVVFQLGGGPLLDGTNTDSIIRAIKLIYDKCIDAGVLAIDCTEGPSTASDTDSEKAAVIQLNTWKRAYAQARGGVLLANAQAALVDGTDANGHPRSNVTDDGTHHSSTGAQLQGQVVYELLKDRIPFMDVLPCSLADTRALSDYGNYVTAPLFNGTGGSNTGTGASGDVGTGWIHAVSGSISAAATKVAREDSLGEWQQSAISGAGANAYDAYLHIINSGINAGDTVRALIEVDADDDFSEVAEVTLEVAFRESSADVLTLIGMDGDDYEIDSVGNMVIATPAGTIPEGCDEIYVTARLTFLSTASAGTATIRWGRCELRPVYDL